MDDCCDWLTDDSTPGAATLDDNENEVEDESIAGKFRGKGKEINRSPRLITWRPGGGLAGKMPRSTASYPIDQDSRPSWNEPDWLIPRPQFPPSTPFTLSLFVFRETVT